MGLGSSSKSGPAPPPPPPPPMPSKSSRAKVDPSQYSEYNPETSLNSPRPIYLLVYPVVYSDANAGRAHWKLYKPELGCANLGPGTSIDVAGGPFHGFQLRFMRDYDLHQTTSKPVTILIAQVAAKHVKDHHAGSSIDTTPIDDIETVAKSVRVPEKSPKPLDPNVGERCQDWTRKVAVELVKAGILPSSAIDVLDQAKKQYNSKPR